MKLNYNVSSSHPTTSVPPHGYQQNYTGNRSGKNTFDSVRLALVIIKLHCARLCVISFRSCLGSSQRRVPSVTRRSNSHSNETPPPHQHNYRHNHSHHNADKTSFISMLHHSVPSLHEYKVRKRNFGVKRVVSRSGHYGVIICCFCCRRGV